MHFVLYLFYMYFNYIQSILFNTTLVPMYYTYFTYTLAKLIAAQKVKQKHLGFTTDFARGLLSKTKFFSFQLRFLDVWNFRSDFSESRFHEIPAPPKNPKTKMSRSYTMVSTEKPLDLSSQLPWSHDHQLQSPLGWSPDLKKAMMGNVSG